MYIGLHAKKRAGKDTLALMIADRWNFGVVAFADPLYAAIRAMFPNIPAVCWEDRNIPVSYLGRSVNQLLQTLGTEWGRNMVDEDVWVTAASLSAGQKQAEFRREGIVFSDVRYANEAEFIIANGGKIICIESGRGVKINEHSSEQGIPDKYIHARIKNDSTVEALWGQFERLNLRS